MAKKLLFGIVATLAVCGFMYVSRVYTVLDNLLQSDGAAYSVLFPILLFAFFIPLFLPSRSRQRLIVSLLLAIVLSYFSSLGSLIVIKLLEHRFWLRKEFIIADLATPLVLLSWLEGPLVLAVYRFISTERAIPH